MNGVLFVLLLLLFCFYCATEMCAVYCIVFFFKSLFSHLLFVVFLVTIFFLFGVVYVSLLFLFCLTCHLLLCKMFCLGRGTRELPRDTAENHQRLFKIKITIKKKRQLSDTRQRRNEQK